MWTSALLSRAWASAAWPASATSWPASLNTGPTTGTSTSRIDSPVRTIAPPAPSAEWVTPRDLVERAARGHARQRPHDHPGDHEHVGEQAAAQMEEPVAHGRGTHCTRGGVMVCL